MAKAILSFILLYAWLLSATLLLGKTGFIPQLHDIEFIFYAGYRHGYGPSLFWAAWPVLFYLWLSADPSYVLSPHERWQRDEYFRQKTRDLEIDYKGKPKALRRRTVLLALLGYGVIWGGIAVLMLGCIAFAQVAGKMAAWVMIIPIGFLLKLAISMLRPRGGDAGVQLKSKDAPALFALLNKLCRKAGGPVFERVFIIAEMNASVSRHTGLLGSFGFGPVTLSLGLPLMQALSEEQIAAVIGHEYGHVAAKDNALGQWVYRIRLGWLHVGEKLKTEPLWHVLRLDRFYRWFIGVFNAYSFTLSRQCEYEADAFAARLTGAAHIAGALVAMEVQGSRLQQSFWHDVWKQAEEMSDPAGSPYQKLGEFLKELPDAAESIKAIKKVEPRYDSTHPSVPDRVRALKAQLAAPEAPETSAATRLLGERLEMHLAAMFDRAWREHSRKAWKKRYQEHQTAAATVHDLEKTGLGRLSREELSQLVSAASALQDDRKVMAVCKEILSREPENAAAKSYLLGLRLVHDGDESALLKLDDLVRLHPEHVPTACRFAIRYFDRQERWEEAKVYQFRLDEWNYQNQAAEEERKHIFATDIFLPHRIAPEYVAKLAAHLKKHGIVGKAWLVQKEVDYMKGSPLFVLAVKARWWSFLNSKSARRKMKQVHLPPEFPPFFRLFWVENVRGLESRLKRVEGARIYTK